MNLDVLYMLFNNQKQRCERKLEEALELANIWHKWKFSVKINITITSDADTENSVASSCLEIEQMGGNTVHDLKQSRLKLQHFSTKPSIDCQIN